MRKLISSLILGITVSMPLSAFAEIDCNSVYQAKESLVSSISTIQDVSRVRHHKYLLANLRNTLINECEYSKDQLEIACHELLEGSLKDLAEIAEAYPGNIEKVVQEIQVSYLKYCSEF